MKSIYYKRQEEVSRQNIFGNGKCGDAYTFTDGVGGIKELYVNTFENRMIYVRKLLETLVNRGFLRLKYVRK